MAKSTKKPAAAPKAAAKPRKPGAKKNPVPAKPTAASVSREQVAELAHRLWKERGGVHGHHEDDWFRAEQALRQKAS
jgi:Protein of unknown function (DUF2934)